MARVDAIPNDLASREPEGLNTVEAKLPNGFPPSVSEPVFDGLLALTDRLIRVPLTTLPLKPLCMSR